MLNNFPHKLSLLSTDYYLALEEVPKRTSQAIHPIIEGELNEIDAIALQANNPNLHFTNSDESPENTILFRLTDVQTHKAFLEMKIRVGKIKVIHGHSKIPLDLCPEDMPSSSSLFRSYIISRDEFIKFANLLSIDVCIDPENQQTESTKKSILLRNQEWQRLAEKFAQDYVAAKKPKLTKGKAALLISDQPKYSKIPSETIERILQKTW